jgi:hypothetical protein
VDFILTPSVFERARADLADLRLYDEREREVPYALRVRRAENRQEPLSARAFNQTKNPDRSVALSLDLGQNTGEHNAIDILTTGTNFRRRVQLQGGNAEKDHRTLFDHAYLVHFQVAAQPVDVHRLHYPVSRFRYLHVRVFPESGNETDKPSIASVTVYRSTQLPGEYLTQPAVLGSREAVRVDGGTPGSAWVLTFGGETAPCERLGFDVADEDFVRPYQLQIVGPGEQPQTIAGGEWRRRAGGEQKPMEIQFPEMTARQLRLVVTDYRNPALTLTGVRYTAAVSQVIFAHAPERTGPLRLYFGNPKAQAPRYDFAANLPAVVEPPPVRAALETVRENPTYQPEPKPWSERWPWLVYVVLGLASLVLLAILGMLAREAMARHDAGVPS